MPVTVSCAICGAKIKDASPGEFRNLTGREICVVCNEKIEEKLQEIEKIKREYIQNVARLNEQANKIYQSLQKANAKFNADAVSLYNTMKTEFEAMKDSIIEAQ